MRDLKALAHTKEASAAVAASGPYDCGPFMTHACILARARDPFLFLQPGLFIRWWHKPRPDSVSLAQIPHLPISLQHPWPSHTLLLPVFFTFSHLGCSQAPLPPVTFGVEALSPFPQPTASQSDLIHLRKEPSACFLLRCSCDSPFSYKSSLNCPPGAPQVLCSGPCLPPSRPPTVPPEHQFRALAISGLLCPSQYALRLCFLSSLTLNSLSPFMEVVNICLSLRESQAL